MRLIIVGAGRAGGSIAIAAGEAGHHLVGLLTRSEQGYGPPLEWTEPLPETDVLLLAVKDDAISDVVQVLKPIVGRVAVAAHMSGFVPVSALHELQGEGVAIGGFHPLVSMPEPVTGARALRDAFVGIDGDQLAIDTLTHFGNSLGMESFHLDDTARPAYHAAAAAAANFVVTSLAVAGDLFDAAGVDPRVARPLVERVVANCFDIGPRQSLTGPIARGDIETVVGHLAAASDVSSAVGQQFLLLAEATAVRAGREEDSKLWR